jgi:hypothetical protein
MWYCGLLMDEIPFSEVSSMERKGYKAFLLMREEMPLLRRDTAVKTQCVYGHNSINKDLMVFLLWWMGNTAFRQMLFPYNHTATGDARDYLAELEGLHIYMA